MTKPPPVPQELPKAIGSRIEDLDTPALLLDWTIAERNILRMADFLQGKPVRLRPHFKNHKCPILALHQVQAGAAGITCAKLSEAEVLADHGFDNLLIANQVVGRTKIERLVELARRVHVQVAIDDLTQATEIAQAASSARVTVGVLIEIDVGMGRCGLPPGRPALELVRQIEQMPGIQFNGLQAYEGHAVYTNDFHRRAELTRLAFHEALYTRELIENDGIPVANLSGGSSSTYQIAAQIEGVTEIQAGTYVTMDWRYAELSPEFEVALSVMARVISKRQGAAVLDVGTKGLGCEFGPPKIKDCPQAELPPVLAEEHAIVRRSPNWRLGDPVQVIPSHACTTCNLYRHLHVHEDGRVVDVWPIEGSGKLT
jgi:D-serine deaminase-like pyridoxal phosphate-dependent protein